MDSLLPLKRISETPLLRVLLVALSLFCLPSCSKTGNVQPIPAKVLPAESCLQRCQLALPPLADPSMGGMVKNYIEAATQYQECRARHDCLVDFERAK